MRLAFRPNISLQGIRRRSLCELWRDRLSRRSRAAALGAVALAKAAEAGSLGSVIKRVGFLVVLLTPLGLTRAEEPRRSPAVVSFTETNPEGQQIRELTFGLTDEPTKTCISGSWKTARAIKDSGHYTKNPAYTLEKGRLEVLLINGPCDSYDSYIGQLKDRAFRGDHVAYGLGFSKTLGKVIGAYSK